jgi:hypothetical protein
MRGVIKGALAEELKNSLRMQKQYAQLLKKLPQGSLSVKMIGGREYYYVAKRVGPKVKFIYKGKVSADEKKLYADAKMNRAKYRKLLSQVKKQVRFLRSALRGKEAI